MKGFFKILLGVIIACAMGGYIYWQKNKKSIVKNSIQNAIQKKSDSLYFIHYDSSEIDEINGNASFYQITLQSDSAQMAMLNTGDSLPGVLYNIRADEITARGIDIAGLLQGKRVTARAVLIKKPVIRIINTGAGNPKPFTYADTLALYKKILGRFTSIRADSIQVINGAVLITDHNGKPLTSLENINILLNNFLIDSTKNYRHIISYFIRDVKVSIENIRLPETANKRRINIANLLYDAPQKLLQVDAVRQYAPGSSQPVADVKNVRISQLNTDAFIVYQQLKAGMVTCDGGLVTIYRRSNSRQQGNGTIVLTNDLVDEAEIGGMQLGKTKIVVIDPDRPHQPAFVINGVKFSVSNIMSHTRANTLTNLINNADWSLSADGFSFVTKQKIYRFTAEGLLLNNKRGAVKINRIVLKPLVTEAGFVKMSKVQNDLFDFSFSNIHFTGLNFKKLVNDNLLETEELSLQPVLKIFSDRTLPVDTSSMLGKYPHQSLLKLPFHFYVRKLQVRNGGVFYTERGQKSAKRGLVDFTKINAQISNITNIAGRIKANGRMVLKAHALFLNKAELVTEWQLPLNSSDTNFTVTGQLGQMDATELNTVTEPLGMASIKKGKINKLLFEVLGDDYRGKGHTTFLYSDLKVSVLKITDGEKLKKRGFLSFLANALIVNDNPKNNKTYIGEINFARDIETSFFNLVWKSIFDGVKNTVIRN